MSSSFTIQLNKLLFTAPHGLFAEEGLVGNDFEVNISLKTVAPTTVVTAINDTINYAEVYRITREIFLVPKALLETLAMEMADALKAAFPTIRELSIQITKLSPPIERFTGSVSVTYHRSFNE